jgi:hypothetical protein
MTNQDAANDTAYMLGALCGAAFIGMVCGLMPLLVGINRKQVALGVVGFVCSAIGGAILNLLLALPVSLIFMAIILGVSSGETGRRRRRFEYEDDDYDRRERRDEGDYGRRDRRDDEGWRRRDDDRYRPRDDRARRREDDDY